MVVSSPTIVNTKYESEMAVGRTLQIPLRANYDTQTKTEGVKRNRAILWVTKSVAGFTKKPAIIWV
mgnify:FL=1